MKKLIAACCLVFILMQTASAQKMIIFESHKRDEPRKAKSRVGEGANSLSLGLLSFVAGYTPVYYERRIFSMLSVVVGGGFTYRNYMNDFGLLMYDEGQESDYFQSRDIKEDYTLYKYRKSVPGAYFAVAPRIYPRDGALDGVYISPMFEYKQYRFTNLIADVTQQPSGFYYGYGNDDADVPRAAATVSEYMHCMDITFNTGGQYQLRNHLIVGWNVGFGLRRASSQRLDIGVHNDSQSAYYENYLRTYSKSKPLFTFDFTMGGWF